MGLQRFIGMLNYYRRFMAGISDVLEPLHQAVTSAGKSKEIQWTAACQTAFEAAKKALSKAALLSHPNLFSTTALTVDALEVTCLLYTSPSPRDS